VRRKLGLVFPRFRYPSGDYPLGLALLAAQLRERLPLDVALLDTSFDPRMERVRAFLDQERPEFLGIALSTLMMPEGLEIGRMAARRGVRVFVGGPQATVGHRALAQQPWLQACVLGEGEGTAVALLDSWLRGRAEPVAGAWVRVEGEVRYGPARPFIQDLDQLPLPAWDLLDMERYLRLWGKLDVLRPGLRGANLSAGRGCPFRCAFCQPVLERIFGRQLRLRSPASLVEELRQLRQRFGIEGFWFTDDSFTADRGWALSFAQALRESELDLPWGCTTRAELADEALLDALARAGLRRLGVGLESASTRVREDIYRKGVSLQDVERCLGAARARGIRTLLFLMLGAPGERPRELLDTIRTAARLPADEASFSLFVPIPGSALYEDLRQQGLRLSEDPADYDYYARQPFRGPLANQALRWLQRAAWARFYAQPQRWGQLGRLAASGQGLRSTALKLRRLGPGRRRSTALHGEWRG